MGEDEAIARLQRGDIRGLETLVRLYQMRAVRTAYLITQDLEIAADVMQSAFIKVYERIEQFDADKPFSPWFLKMVARDAMKAAARRERDRSLDQWLDNRCDSGGLADEADDADPAAQWESAERVEELRAALRTLTVAQRTAIVQRYYLDMSEAEMATDQGCPGGTIKWRLSAARAKLRAALRQTRHNPEVSQ